MRIIAKPPVIGIVMRDHALAIRVIERAREYGFETHWTLRVEELPLRARYVVTSRADGPLEVGYVKPIYVEDYPSISCMLLSLLAMERGGQVSRMIEVAIDPGKTIGVALAVDEVVIGTATYTSIDSLLVGLEEFLRCFGKDRKMTVYVGESGGELSHILIERLKKSIRDINLLMIPEEGSKTAEVGMNLPRDERSALVIYQRAKSQI